MCLVCFGFVLSFSRNLHLSSMTPTVISSSRHDRMKDSCLFPLDAQVEEEADDEEIDYFRTELLYLTGLSQEPTNPLLLYLK